MTESENDEYDQELIINLSNTKYSVMSETSKELKYKISYDN